MGIPIHPGTRVGELLEAYPQVENALVRFAPAFAKLRNPVLRKTVAKVATLEQAARVGGVSVRELVNALRREAGQEEVPAAGPSTLVAIGNAMPAWTAGAKIAVSIDADAMLETGTHPLGAVRSAAERLREGEAVRLTSSFRPAPLLDALSAAGFAVHSREAAPGRHETLIGARRAG